MHDSTHHSVDPQKDPPNHFWDNYASWEEAEAAWDVAARQAEVQQPIKGLRELPKMPGITDDTASKLKWKSLKYMVAHDAGGTIRKNFFRHPLRYSTAFLRSSIKKTSYSRQGDFFCYGVESIEDFAQMLEEGNSIVVVGFSYCHKPHECPSGRFNDECISDLDNPICRQCFIGKSLHALPSSSNVHTYIIPTIHYIGQKMFELRHQHPGKKILFLISACELTLTMFGDWGNMIDAHGLGVRLDGRICNTMRAFELSEVGIKPGLTVVLPETQQTILNLIKEIRKNNK